MNESEKKDEKPKDPRLGKNKTLKIRFYRKKIPEKKPYIRKPLPPKPIEDPIAKERRLLQIRKAQNSRYVMDQTQPKLYNSLRYLGPVLRYFCAKYDMNNNDLYILLNVYNLPHFTKDEFDRATILTKGNCNSDLFRFIKTGYVLEVKKNVLFNEGVASQVKLPTGRYRLSIQALKRIKAIYDVFENIEELNAGNEDPFYPLPAIDLMINKFNREVRDFKSGKKAREKMIVTEESKKRLKRK